MSPIALNLLGAFQATLNGRPITTFATDKVRALLTYLALESSRPHARASLATLLWPHLPTEAALDNLRKTIYRLRQTLARAAPDAPPLLAINSQTLHFIAPPTTVDLLTFQILLAEAQTHAHPSLAECDACLARLGQAAELYQGELLAGFGLPDAPAFEEWLLFWRESLQQQAVLALLALSKAWETREDWPRAHLLVGRVLQLDPYHDEAHRQKMRLLHRMGMAQQALAHYAAYTRLLQSETGLEVDPATSTLAAQLRTTTPPAWADIRRRESPALPDPMLDAPMSLETPFSNVPDTGRIYGRQPALPRLTQWLTQDRCRLVAVVGMGGMGKTTLAAAATRTVAPHFEVILWRALINAPPLDELLSEWLRILAGDASRPADSKTVPESLDAQLAALLDHLRVRRCLLVLDNLESIFQPDQAGQPRPEHQNYTHLIRTVAELQHQSCLLLTSREMPHAMARLEEDLFAVRSLHLEGLDDQAAQSMLQDRGLVQMDVESHTLTALYSGNPLALKLVAEMILELFGGDIASFLATETVIFDDIRTVLDWQFNRLTPLEQEILLWLAVEREPLALRALRDNLVPTRPMGEVLAALRGLQRRSLLDHVGMDAARAGRAGTLAESRFALQNVLMEYLTDRLLGLAAQELHHEEVHHLHHHALLNAHASERVRQSQVRLLLRPLAQQLQARAGKAHAIAKLARILAALRAAAPLPHSYGAGNLLNLLLMLDADLTGYDCSHLCVRQADLRQAKLAQVNFAGADLTQSTFAESFGLIYAVAYSPDGAILAAGTNNGELRLWQAADGRLLQIYQGHQGTVKALAFSPTGARLASGGEDATVRLWHVAENGTDAMPTDARMPTILHGHTGRVTAVAFDPTGTLLASGGVDHTIRLWDIATGALVAELLGHEHWVWGLAFDAAGTTLASTSYDHTVRLWHVASATPRAILRGHTDIASGVVFARHSPWLASSSYDGTVRLWDSASGAARQIVTSLPDEINAIAINPSDDTLAFGGDDNLARMWDVERGNLRHLLQGHDSDILTLAFSPDGQRLATGSSDQSVRVWDTASGRLRQTIMGHSQSIRALAHHPHGKIVASAHYDHVVRLWNLASHTITQTLPGHTKAVQSVTFSQDGAWLASGGDDHLIRVWRLDAHGRAFHHHTLPSQHGRVTSLSFSPDGTTLVSGGYGALTCVWEVASGRLRRVLPGHESPISGIHFSPDGTCIAIVSRSQKIRLWASDSATLLHSWRGHRGIINTLRFAPDGQVLVTGGGDGMICLWDVRAASPVLRATLPGHTDRVFAIGISDDGQRMVSGSADGSVRLWDLPRGHLLRTLLGHTHWVWAVGISPDGKLLSSGGPDETLRLWDAERGTTLAILTDVGPYANMNISQVTGLSPATKATLLRLGAVESDPLQGKPPDDSNAP